ncbi:MAG: acetate kinase [Kiritimatiellia bacterium]
MSKSIRTVLVVNAGSSSLKFMLFDMSDEHVMAKGQVERIGMTGSRMTFKDAAGNEFRNDVDAPNHTAALTHVCKMLVDPEKGCLKSLDEIDAVGHRIVHGGEKYSSPVLITPEAIEDIRQLTPLAPLHNPGCIDGVICCGKILGKVPHVGIFDTAFHQTMPAESYLYALPKELHDQLAVRKYGFHGTSHKFVTQRASQVLGIPLDKLSIITCHLGNGSSISAIKNGKCFDTSMGMTPLAGVMMGTRSGDVDPAVILYLLKQGYTADQIDDMFNKQGGVLALGGTGSSDMRDLCSACAKGSADAILTMKRLVHSYLMYIGGYIALLGHVDAIIMTGGIGENSFETREAILEHLAGFGITFDKALNQTLRGKEGRLSNDDSSIPVYVLPTNEELMIARETFALLTK